MLAVKKGLRTSTGESLPQMNFEPCTRRSLKVVFRHQLADLQAYFDHIAQADPLARRILLPRAD